MLVTRYLFSIGQAAPPHSLKLLKSLLEGSCMYLDTMARETKVRPTFVQSSICTILLLVLSLSTLPLTLFATTTCYIVSFLTNNRLGANTRRTSVRRRTILITGARANKALTLIRAFKREGHRVVAADEEKWGRYAMSRFSRGVDSYWLLPDPSTDDRRYIDALKRIVMEEGVDAWIPCSSVQATMLDAESAKEIREEHLGGPQGCECFIPEPFVAGTLHWKDQFEDLLRELSIDVPDSKVVTSVADAVNFLHSPETQQKGHKYILKCLTLDDLGRDDLTLFPLSAPEETSKHLSNIPTPITKKDPFLLQQFLHGPEYCTHVAARDGELVAFVACRSNQLLMRYADVTNLGEEERTMGVRMEKWSQDFLDLYKAKLQNEGKTGPEYALTGHFSFDFIYEENEQKMYALECNVRAHTAVALFSSHPMLASHYLGDTTTVARPARGTAARSWLAHALPLTVARALIPSFLCPYIHPQLQSTLYPSAPLPYSIVEALGVDPTASPPPSVGPLHLLKAYLIDGTDKDGVWDWTDPVPFFVLCHVTWPWLLVNRMRRGVAWSRVNVSTSRVFEC